MQSLCSRSAIYPYIPGIYSNTDAVGQEKSVSRPPCQIYHQAVRIMPPAPTGAGSAGSGSREIAERYLSVPE